MIRIALLGAGYAGRVQLTGWRTIPNVQVMGVWNRTHSRAEQLGAEFVVPAVEDVDALIRREDVDAVDIATAVETHRELTERAAAAGKHVLCQKPMAPTYQDAKAMVDACDRAGVRLMVNENWRWRPWYRAVRALLDQGALGHLHFMRIALRTDVAVTTPDRSSEQLFAGQSFLKTMDPLVLFELGPHHFDVTRYLFGDPHGVFARVHKVSPHIAGEDVAVAILEYPDRTATVELSWHAVGHTSDRSKRIHPDTLVIEGSEGFLSLEEDGQPRVRYRDGRQETLEVDVVGGYQRSWTDALRHFADCLEAGAPFETAGDQNLLTLQLVFAGYQSARTGQPVRITQEGDV